MLARKERKNICILQKLVHTQKGMEPTSPCQECDNTSSGTTRLGHCVVYICPQGIFLWGGRLLNQTLTTPTPQMNIFGA